MMILYGVVGGFGLGLIYLPAVVAVGHYFESKEYKINYLNWKFLKYSIRIKIVFMELLFLDL